jgi:hypothetical protein
MRVFWELFKINWVPSFEELEIALGKSVRPAKITNPDVALTNLS